MRKRLAAILLAVSCTQAGADPGFVPIELVTYAIGSFAFGTTDRLQGEIEFRGGFSLVSNNRDFGALSGLEILPDGTLVAIADTGFWLTARLIEENGRLTGIADARFAPILDAAGDEANRKMSADAEGLRLAADGRSVLVSFEQDHRVSRFGLPDLSVALPTPIALPELTGLAGNRGIEAIAVAPRFQPARRGDGDLLRAGTGRRRQRPRLGPGRPPAPAPSASACPGSSTSPTPPSSRTATSSSWSGGSP